MRLLRCPVSTPLGDIILLHDQDALVALLWGDGIDRGRAHLNRHLPAWTEDTVSSIPGCTDALEAYFAGDIRALSAIRVRPPGTPFQREVWSTLATISPGEAWSYKTLAARVGRPTAQRAVAGTNSKNPIPLVIPCHRVIAADGQLGGFSCGLHRKIWLLEHEGIPFKTRERSPSST